MTRTLGWLLFGLMAFATVESTIAILWLGTCTAILSHTFEIATCVILGWIGLRMAIRKDDGLSKEI
jgi:hypothetical protein